MLLLAVHRGEMSSCCRLYRETSLLYCFLLALPTPLEKFFSPPSRSPFSSPPSLLLSLSSLSFPLLSTESASTIVEGRRMNDEGADNSRGWTDLCSRIKDNHLLTICTFDKRCTHPPSFVLSSCLPRGTCSSEIFTLCVHLSLRLSRCTLATALQMSPSFLPSFLPACLPRL